MIDIVRWSIIGNIAATCLNLFAVYLNLRSEYRFNQSRRRVDDIFQDLIEAKEKGGSIKIEEVEM